jgi:hypothetical protein
MSPVRPFPFGKEPAAMRAASTGPLPPAKSHATAPLVDFVPPAHTLPFREPRITPMLPPAPLVPPSPLVPPPPRRVRAQPWISFRSPAAIALLVFDMVVLVYLVATWGR